MKNEIQIIEGKIISSQLGEFGKKEILYGYIGVEINPTHHVAIKIDSYTSYETLEIGDHVVIEASRLGTTDILVARKISLKTAVDSSSVMEEITATTL
jgi:hypothetical protein